MTETPTEGVGTPTPRLNGYLCLFGPTGATVEIRTNDGAYAAQQAAERFFAQKYPRRKIKAGQVTAHLAEQYGEPVTHTAVD